MALSTRPAKRLERPFTDGVDELCLLFLGQFDQTIAAAARAELKAITEQYELSPTGLRTVTVGSSR
ncbi:MAG TPA: hypothetical protein DCY82_13500 [Acidimicrobiaceae bacterium]|nr:hypothetical protein [Acidimicrobiaceae bacterium]